jgi:hypothetical protein
MMAAGQRWTQDKIREECERKAKAGTGNRRLNHCNGYLFNGSGRQKQKTRKAVSKRALGKK